MEAVVGKLDAMANEIKDTLTDFLINKSAIAPMNMDEVFCFSPEGSRYYADMDGDGVKMQASLSGSYEEFYSQLQSALKDQSEDVQAKLIKSREVITRAIDHRITWCNSTQEVLQFVLAALEGQVSILKNAYGEPVK